MERLRVNAEMGCDRFAGCAKSYSRQLLPAVDGVQLNIRMKIDMPISSGFELRHGLRLLKRLASIFQICRL